MQITRNISRTNWLICRSIMSMEMSMLARAAGSPELSKIAT